MAVDAAMRTLKVPAKFMPYLEKHRAYELFHELAVELVMEKPKDPLQFLKTCLERLERSRDRRLVILLTPPYLDRIRLAQLISLKTGCGIISKYLVCSNPGNFYDPFTLAKGTADLIKSSDRDGWILADFPSTVEEAKLLVKYGLLPTHVFLFLETDGEDEVSDAEDPLKTVDVTPSIFQECDNFTHHMKQLFKSSLKVVKINKRSLEELGNACAKLTKKMPPRPAPKLFRVALIGPRGSRRRTLGKLLQKRFELVHVDMEELLNSARVQENKVGDEIRFMDKSNHPYSFKMVFGLLKTRLSQKDCLDRGYVLTNFPTSVEDFVLLDSLDNPPNRVIFLDITDSQCEDRLRDRVVNMHSGGLYSKIAIEYDSLLKSQALTHPDDEECKVREDIRFYNSRVQAMLEYCGMTGFQVDAIGPIAALYERVEAVLMGPAPACKPRTGKLPARRVSVATSSFKKPSPMSLPVSRTEVLPLIDSEELMRRFQELKKGTHDKLPVIVETVSETYCDDCLGDLREKYCDSCLRVLPNQCKDGKAVQEEQYCKMCLGDVEQECREFAMVGPIKRYCDSCLILIRQECSEGEEERREKYCESCLNVLNKECQDVGINHQ